MTPFSWKIVTPDGVCFDAQAEELIVRTPSGDIGILAGHVNCVVPLGMGEAMVLVEGKIKNRFVLSFLHYIPYAVLSVMTVPAIFYATGERLDEQEARAYLQNLLGNGIVNEREARMIAASLSDGALSDVTPEGRRIVRANIFKHILLSLM